MFDTLPADQNRATITPHVDHRRSGAPATSATDILILTAPTYSAFALVSVLEVFRAANVLLPGSAVRWSIAEGQPNAKSAALHEIVSGGVPVSRTEVRSRRHSLTLVFIDSPDIPAELASTIRSAYRMGSTVVEIGSGAFLLPTLGLLDQPRCSVHPDDRATFREKFPEIDVANTMFTVGRRSISCCGQLGAIELALYLVSQLRGTDVAARVRSSMLLPSHGSDDDFSSVAVPHHQQPRNRHLRRAIEIMETHIEDPLSQTQVARHCGVSSRQLQRLFSDVLGETFNDVYMRLRLGRATELLKKTDMAIVDIAIACGFTSGSYFAQAFRRRWNSKPSHVRSTSEKPLPL